MKCLLPTKFKVVLLFTFFLSLLGSSFYAGRVLAEDAFPPPGRIPCNADPENPEFSSDRPYQGSPCGDNRPTAFFCGNAVVIWLGTVSVPYCDESNGKKTSCSANIHKDQTIDVDLTDVELPILGNTQDTKNSQSSAEIDDGTKVSNYVSWYLGGTNDKAESAIDPTTPEGISEIINTSGPIKKLLPSIIQEAARTNVINTYDDTSKYTDDESGKTVTEQQNHNQIVVCDKSNIPLIGDLLEIGTFTPTNCYKGDGSGVPKKQLNRLSDWDGNLSIWNSGINKLVNGLASLFPHLPADVIRTSIGDHWDKRTPPLPWSDKDGKPFVNDVLYQKAYNEWRGNTCILVPVVNLLVCTENIFVPNKYADLFQYVPLANTVDKKGSQLVTETIIRAPEATLENTAYEINNIPQLYLAHSLENAQLAALLKSTFKPQDNLVGSTTPKDVEDNSMTCRILNSKTNPGDDATFGTPKSHINVDVHYDVTEIQCTTPKYTCSALGCYWKATCKSDVFATIPSTSKTPYADEIWKDTVAGGDSIFRRIYPKTGPDSPVSCIADNPAVSAATYTVNEGVSSPGIQITKVIEPDTSEVLAQSGTNSVAAQLYYPHYGGVLDYFLNGIQTALRPQGYGNPSPESGQYCDNITCGELPKNMPKASGSCSLGGISSRVGKIPKSLKDIIEAAAQEYKVPPNLILGIMYGEGLFNPGRFNWTDQNVKNWATCQKIPGCNETGDDNFMGFIGNDFQNIISNSSFINAYKRIDPDRKKYSQCNLMDSIFAVAWNLNNSAAGGGGLPATCFGIGLKSFKPSSCSWNDNQYESAIKIAESGYTDMCFTKENSCLMGGGTDAACPLGDTCETISNRYSNSSHNACIWDVGHGN